MNRRHGIFLFIVVALALGVTADEEALGLDDSTWSRFRGPNGSGVSHASGLPVRFGPSENVVWKTELPPGHSSPVLSNDRVFLTAFDGEDLSTYALDRSSGEIVWSRSAPRARSEIVDGRNTPASPTPVTDGANVYVFFPDFGLLSYGPEGEERFRLPLGPFDNAYGMGSSPIDAGETIVLVCDQATGSFLIAVDKENGKIAWRTDRSEYKTGHSTPVLYRPEEGGTQLLVPGSFRLTAYDAGTGDSLWWVTGLAFEMKATPVFDESESTVFIHGTSGDRAVVPPFERVLAAHDGNGDDRLSAEESKDGVVKWFRLMDLDGNDHLDADEWSYYRAARATPGGMYGFRLGGRGDVTAENLRWHHGSSVPQLPSSILYQGVLHMINDQGIVTSLEPATGKVIRRGRIEGAIDNFFASPVAADGKIFLVSESGKAVVLEPDGSLGVLAVNPLDDSVYATPAIAEGRLYIRTASALYSFGLPASSSPEP